VWLHTGDRNVLARVEQEVVMCSYKSSKYFDELVCMHMITSRFAVARTLHQKTPADTWKFEVAYPFLVYSIYDATPTSDFILDCMWLLMLSH